MVICHEQRDCPGIPWPCKCEIQKKPGIPATRLTGPQYQTFMLFLQEKLFSGERSHIPNQDAVTGEINLVGFPEVIQDCGNSLTTRTGIVGNVLLGQ